MLRYDTGKGEYKDWIVEEAAFDSRYLGKCESIFCQGNGYIGQRAALEESYINETRNLFVTGTFNSFDGDEVTELPNLPDLTAMRIIIDGYPFSMERGKILNYSRRLNLKTGELERNVGFETLDKKQLELSFRRFVSLSDEHIIAFRTEIKAQQDIQITIESGIDGRVSNTGSQHFKEGEKRLLDGRYLRMSSRTTNSNVLCTQHVAHSFKIDGKAVSAGFVPVIDRRQFYIRQSISLDAGETLFIEKICAVHSSRDMAYYKKQDTQAQIEKDGLETIEKAYKMGYKLLFEQSRIAWQKLWEAQDIYIESTDSYDRLALRFALYHLNIMVKKDDDRVGIAAKGLSGEGYKGHSFWDTEIFILPYFTFTQPQVAKALLSYRYNTLPGARRKAHENGYKGAMYPWESAWLDDGEVTPLWGAADIKTGLPMKIWTGLIEQHISSDIAFAVWQYYMVSGDKNFMHNKGYEIIIDTARFWASRAEFNEEKQRYEYNGVIGPDEYKEHVNNNAYTNYMAAWNMKKALEIIKSLEPDLYDKFNNQFDLEASYRDIENVLKKLYLPKPDQNGILPQFDGYFDLKTIDLSPYKKSPDVGTIYNDYNNDELRNIQVSKQADVLVLFFLLEELFSSDMKKTNYTFYEDRTLHDSSLSKSTHSVLAADLGLQEIAYEFFRGSANIDLGPNMKSSDMGIHSASMGGIWQCAVYGFGGLRMKKGELHISPRLPEKWDSLAFNVTYKQQALKVKADKNGVSVTNFGENVVEVVLYGEKREVKSLQTISVIKQ
ncbi:MAG: glycosyl hydrolase family 65 protein [Eubacteriales bacterium]|nr:glycosyl hydrolase family 65 protein [Eubacteriales bacterium]